MNESTTSLCYKKPHAVLDRNSRENKAKKISALVGSYGAPPFRRILEVGTGSGYIAWYFSQQEGALVHAVDVVDQRQVTEGFDFQLVTGTDLPFSGELFDLVISNHVIEHVGSSDDQRQHLQEIFRCLKRGATLYFAVPNRWRLLEPHYRLPLLSWLPASLASVYVRAMKRGSAYDCNCLSNRLAHELLRQCGFECFDATVDAIPLVGKFEGGWLTRYISKLPKPLWQLFGAVLPTVIIVCRKPV